MQIPMFSNYLYSFPIYTIMIPIQADNFMLSQNWQTETTQAPEAPWAEPKKPFQFGSQTEETIKNTDANFNIELKVPLTFSESKIAPKSDVQSKVRPKESEKADFGTKSRQYDQESSEYVPFERDANRRHCYYFSETKNVPKSFGKSIINFILSQKELTTRVLAYYNCDPVRFYAFTRDIYKRVGTIAELRGLWLKRSNPYAQVLRVLTNRYLKAYNLQYIFNSRVSNHERHIKYRNKMLQAVADPQNFTNMKDF